MRGASLLSRWAGEGQEPADSAWTYAAEVDRQYARLARGLRVCALIAEWPRRLGGDVDDAALAHDKKTARRVGHRLLMARDWWLQEEGDVEVDLDDPALRQEAASLDWQRWWEAWLAHLNAEAGRIARSSLKLGKLKEGNRCVHRLEQEAARLRDVFEREDQTK